ncbi:MAG: 2-C-methyl-D-erythritol 4-phosphate cytidylyltransferase [Phycisphaerae bacterium]
MGRIAAIVVAAGKGERFGGPEKKIFAKIDNRAIFLRSLEHFVNRDDVIQTILVIAPEDQEEVKQKYGANLGFMGVQSAVGGATRTDSVANALTLVREDAEYVAIHDAARPCVSMAMIEAVLAEARKTGAAILAAPLRGTIKRGSASGFVDATLSREGLWEAQTPQVFKRDVILEAYARRADVPGPITDDAQLVEAAGHPVALVESDFSNLKITTRGDLTLASAIIKSRPRPAPKAPMGPFQEAQW